MTIQMRKTILLLGVLAAFILGMWVSRNPGARQAFIGAGEIVSFPEDVPGKENLGKLETGCPFKDCLPSIDSPEFESIESANTWLADDEWVVAVDFEGEQRVYPVKILNWHEVVNDTIAGVPVAVTYAPLTGSPRVFIRDIEGKIVTFGVSGKLLNSNTLLYDRETGSLWQQFTGEAIVGKWFGEHLVQESVDLVVWQDWRQTYPQTQVLSRPTKNPRDYTRYPYGNYETDEAIHYPVEGAVDTLIHPKTVVYGLVTENGQPKAYTLQALERETAADGVLIDTLGRQRIRLAYNRGVVTAENLSLREPWFLVRSFWFVWKAFYPQSLLYE